MKIEAVELRRISIPMISPFRVSFGVEHQRDILLVHIVGTETEGWGVRRHVPAALLRGVHRRSRGCDAPPPAAAPLRGRRRHRGSGRRDPPSAPRSSHGEGGTRDGDPRRRVARRGRLAGRPPRSSSHQVDCGVSVGIHEDPAELVEVVDGYLAEGYRRIKLKIEPGHDVEAVRAVRERFPAILLQVDANTAYTLGDAPQLAKLDEFDLLLIEQPLAEDDVRGHAELARLLRTPICLDESITSSRSAEDAIALGACRVVNIKAGRVGGYLQARRVHDVCEARGVPVWCGGMLETGLGRAANVALAALPNFTLPGDTSASGRYYA
jgi:O-succinylbenzoate synthase